MVRRKKVKGKLCNCGGLIQCACGSKKIKEIYKGPIKGEFIYDNGWIFEEYIKYPKTYKYSKFICCECGDEIVVK